MLKAIALATVFVLSSLSFAQDDQIRHYLIVNLDKADTNKFNDILARCGGTIIQKYSDNTVLMELTVQQGICVSETTSKIIIEIRERKQRVSNTV